MVKKKAKSKSKRSKLRVKSKKKPVRRAKAGKKSTALKEKIIGMVDHYFGHISVAAFRVKNPLKVGDMIHVKGHTTDFVQRVDSMQSNHKDLAKAARGVEIGIKVAGKCRVGDTVFLAAKEQGITAQTALQKQPAFPAMGFGRQTQPTQRPAIQQSATQPRPQAKPQQKPSGGYEQKKFFQF
ncbi:MAG: hypothetical protein JW782_00280 [Candidatus Saganbacteria bacterium]|nr:hypothetical protein [Candidatus Saganbacteria bacterium]